MENAKEIAKLVEREIAAILDASLQQRIRELVVTPYPVERAWDYGLRDQKYTCWTVLEHRPSNTGVAFCSQGFGPSYPWGIVFLSGPHMGIGMDSGWFLSLEHAMRQSAAWPGPNPTGYEVP
jgi:hypothetical protein